MGDIYDYIEDVKHGRAEERLGKKDKDMKLNMELDLNQIYSGNGWDESIADLLKEEIKTVIRSAVRAEVKKQETAIKKAAAEMVQKAYKALSEKEIHKAALSMLQEKIK